MPGTRGPAMMRTFTAATTWKWQTGFLDLNTSDLLGQMILCCGSSSVHCRMFGNILGLYPQDDSSTPVSVVTPKMSLDTALDEKLCFPPRSPSWGCASLPILHWGDSPNTWSGPLFSPSTHSPLSDLNHSIFIYQTPSIQRPLGPFYLADPQIAQTLSDQTEQSPSPLPRLPGSGPPLILPFNREYHQPIQSPKPQPWHYPQCLHI